MGVLPPLVLKFAEVEVITEIMISRVATAITNYLWCNYTILLEMYMNLDSNEYTFT